MTSQHKPRLRAFLHQQDCRCGCAFVAGLDGTVIEEAAGWTIGEFFVPSLTGAAPRRHLWACESDERSENR